MDTDLTDSESFQHSVHFLSAEYEQQLYQTEDALFPHVSLHVRALRADCRAESGEARL